MKHAPNSVRNRRRHLRTLSIAAGLAILAPLGLASSAWAVTGSTTDGVDFTSFTWTVDRQAPSSYTLAADSLTMFVDSSAQSTVSSYYYFEGLQAPIAAGTPWVDQVDSVGATLSVDAAWASIPGMEAGLWLRSNDPSAPASPAWPTLVVTNYNVDGLNPTNALVAAVFDTFTGNWEGVTPVSVGDVLLEIALNPLNHEFEYYVSGTKVFSHDATGYEPPSAVLFNNYNVGGPANDYTVVWNDLEFGTKIAPPAITTATLPAVTSRTFSAPIAAFSNTPGSIAPVTFSVSSGTLPPGLTLNPTTGVLSGTFTAAGTFPFSVTASNGADYNATADFSLVVPADLFLAVTGADTQSLMAGGLAALVFVVIGLSLVILRRRLN